MSCPLPRAPTALLRVLVWLYQNGCSKTRWEKSDALVVCLPQPFEGRYVWGSGFFVNHPPKKCLQCILFAGEKNKENNFMGKYISNFFFHIFSIDYFSKLGRSIVWAPIFFRLSETYLAGDSTRTPESPKGAWALRLSSAQDATGCHSRTSLKVQGTATHIRDRCLFFIPPPPW